MRLACTILINGHAAYAKASLGVTKADIPWRMHSRSFRTLALRAGLRDLSLEERLRGLVPTV